MEDSLTRKASHDNILLLILIWWCIMIKYKINIMNSLKNKGYSSYKLRKEKIFGEATMTKFRNEEPINFDNLNIICTLLNCQPGDILEYIPDPLIKDETN